MRFLLWVFCVVWSDFAVTRCDRCPNEPITFNGTEARLCLKGKCVSEYLHGCLSDRASERVTIVSNVETLEWGAIQHMPNLWFLDASGVALQRVEPNAFLHLPELSTVVLRGNSIGVVKDRVFQDTFAEYVDLSYNRIHYLEERAFSNMSRLKVLKINDNHIKNLGLKLFAESPNVDALNFARNEINTLDLNVLFPIISITILDVSFNKIFEVIPAYLESNCSTLLLAGNNVDRVNFLGTLRIKRLNLAMNSLARFSIGFPDLVGAGTELFVHPNPWMCACLREFEAMGRRLNVTQRLPSSDRTLIWKDDYPVCVTGAAPSEECEDYGEDDFRRARQDYFRRITYYEIVDYAVVDKHYQQDLQDYVSTVEVAKHMDSGNF